MLNIAELPTDLVSYLEAIEEDISPTDYCLDTFEHLYLLATDKAPIAFDVLQAFLSTCMGN